MIDNRYPDRTRFVGPFLDPYFFYSVIDMHINSILTIVLIVHTSLFPKHTDGSGGVDGGGTTTGSGGGWIRRKGKRCA